MKQAERAAKKGKKGAKGEEEKEEAVEPDNVGIHPARLAMMSGNDRPSYPTHRQRY
jgi:nucleolar protein 6